MESFYEENGIAKNFSAVRTLKQNDIAERKTKQLLRQIEQWLLKLVYPWNFGWKLWIQYVLCKIDESLSKETKITYEVIKGRKHNISYFHVFGCPCVIINQTYQLSKFQSQT